MVPLNDKSEPIVLYRTENGRLKIRCGFHRLKALVETKQLENIEFVLEDEI